MISASTQELAIVGYGSVVLKYDELNAIRRTLSIAGRKLPPAFLKNAEEQTIAGFAAMSQAIENFSMDTTTFSDWGVIAAPRFVGRASGAVAMARFDELGPSSTSVHIIPQQSLHSLSGAVSVAMGLHGPNFGVGGGPNAALEGFLTVLGSVDWQSVPGMWLVLTEWNPEPIPDKSGKPTNAALCFGLALALVQPRPNESAPRLRIELPTTGSDDSPRQCSTSADLAGVRAISDVIHGMANSHSGSSWSHQLEWGAWIELAS